MNGWNLRNTLNWSFVSDYVQWLTTNEADLRNLDLDSHWRNKMTPEEIEMKKHPNRSAQWIPNRIGEIRDKLRKELFLYVGQRVASKGSKHIPIFTNCIGCEVTEDQIREYIDDFKGRMNYSNKKEQYPLSSRSRTPDQDWDLTQKRVLQEMSQEYPHTVVDASHYYLPTLSTEYMGYGHQWGLCQHCYPIEMNKLTNMLLRDLNKVK